MVQKRNRYNSGTNGTGAGYGKTRSSYNEIPTADRKMKFLVAYQWGAGVAEAARFASIPKSTLYRWRDEDAEFAQSWREGRNNLVNDLEIQAFKRALEGNDRLLMFILKSYKPGTFNQRQQQPKPSGPKAANLIELVEKVREWI